MKKKKKRKTRSIRASGSPKGAFFFFLFLLLVSSVSLCASATRLFQRRSHDFGSGCVISAFPSHSSGPQLGSNSTGIELRAWPGAISAASPCALIVSFRTMFPCSLRRLGLISLPLPCFLARGCISHHIGLDKEERKEGKKEK